jgi:hypothetical protein
MFSFYGIATVLDSTYDAKMPDAYTDWVEAAFDWARVDWPSIFIPAECTPFTTGSSFRAWLLMKAIAPLLFIMVVTLGTAARKAARLGWSRKNMGIGALQAMPLALLLSFCACPSVSMSIFQSWLCVEYQYDGRRVDAPAIEYKYLSQDLRVRCSDDRFTEPEHDTITSLACALMFVWPVGMVGLYAAAVLPCAKSLNAHVQTPLTQATRFIHRDCTLVAVELQPCLNRTLCLLLFISASPTCLARPRQVLLLGAGRAQPPQLPHRLGAAH